MEEVGRSAQAPCCRNLALGGAAEVAEVARSKSTRAALSFSEWAQSGRVKTSMASKSGVGARGGRTRMERGHEVPLQWRLAVAVLLLHAPRINAACEPWCDDACAQLNGDVMQECGDCKGEQRCQPGAADFPTTMHVEVDAGGTAGMGGGGMGGGGTSGGGMGGDGGGKDGRREGDEQGTVYQMKAPKDDGTFHLPHAYRRPGCDLWRTDVSHVTRDLLMRAPWPFIIDGLTSNWSALANWKQESMLERHGGEPFHLHGTYNESLARLLRIDGKYHMGHAVYPRHGCYSDPWRPYTPFLFDQLSGEYHVAPFFMPMSTFQMGIGRGAGVGVPPENHPSSWFAAVVGRKRWLLHPDTEPQPPVAMEGSGSKTLCAVNEKLRTPTTLECVQEEGDVIWVPNYWWHETCGLDGYSCGVGGITWADCDRDIDHSVPADTDCTGDSYKGYSYRVQDIPHCQENPGKCGTLADVSF